MNLPDKEYSVNGKSLIDYSVALICLILSIPVIIVLAALIKITSKGPVIYAQKRLGKAGKPFTIYKLRSMKFGTESGIPLLTGKTDERITPVGRFMRKHKFDEIPNFINVLKGEMSIVGPRPEQKYFVDQLVNVEPRYLLLQKIKPGITSWGQVKYGYASNADQMIERLSYDLYYLENLSLWFDLKIALHTIAIIIKGQAI